MKFALLLILLCCPFCEGQTIYATEFEEYEDGAENLDDWIGNSPGTGSYGLDYELVSGLQNSAFIGFERPARSLVTLVKAHDFDPVAAGTPTVILESLLGVEDSTNGRRDTFSIVFLNTSGDLLASIQFRNDDDVFGLWYSDGVTIRDSGLDFVRGELQLLTIEIDFAINRWSVQLDGIDIIRNVVFYNGNKEIDLGFTGVQWDLTNNVTLGYGDNYLLIADWFVRAVPTTTFKVLGFSRAGIVNEILFEPEAGFSYQLQTSPDLSTDFQDEDSQMTENGLRYSDSRRISFSRVVRRYATPASE
jgi:hypothetical protein